MLHSSVAELCGQARAATGSRWTGCARRYRYARVEEDFKRNRIDEREYEIRLDQIRRDSLLQ